MLALTQCELRLAERCGLSPARFTLKGAVGQGHPHDTSIPLLLETIKGVNERLRIENMAVNPTTPYNKSCVSGLGRPHNEIGEASLSLPFWLVQGLRVSVHCGPE